MANISSTFGTISFTCDTEETLKNLYKAFTYLGKGEYCTWLDEKEPCNVACADGKIKNEVAFTGTGRWSYFANCREWADWVIAETRIKNTESLIDSLEKSEFTMFFSYIDEEAGNELLEKASLTLFHKANTPLTQTEVIKGGSTEYPYTLANLMELNAYDDFEQTFENVYPTIAGDDDIDNRHFIEELKSFFEITLYEQDRLEKFLNCKLDDLNEELYPEFVRCWKQAKEMFSEEDIFDEH